MRLWKIFNILLLLTISHYLYAEESAFKGQYSHSFEGRRAGEVSILFPVEHVKNGFGFSLEGVSLGGSWRTDPIELGGGRGTLQ